MTISEAHINPHPVEILKKEYLARRKANANYSLSAFARDLGLSVSFLSRLLRGERSMTVNQTVQMGTILGLNAKQIDESLSALIHAAPANAKISKKFMSAVKKNPRTDSAGADSISFLQVERFKAISDWYHLAILNLTKVKNFNPDPAKIAKRLGITRVEAEDAVQRLLTLGLLEQRKQTLVRTQASLYIKTSKSERAIREFTKQTLKKASIALDDTSEDAFEKRCMPGTTLPIQSKMLPYLKDKILKFQLEFAELAKSETYDEVYQFNLMLFPLSEPNPNPKKKVET